MSPFGTGLGKLCRACVSVASATCLGACGGGGPPMRFVLSTPHEVYEAQLREVGLHRTALGREWITAAERALAMPIEVALPHREARYLDPAGAVAAAYRIALERGQRLMVRIDVADARPDDLRLFLDLFYVLDGVPSRQLVSSADSSGWTLEYVALRPGDYLLRMQPELLRGGRVTLTVSAHASLDFPVAGRGMSAIRSRFGAPRDAGQRDHHGVDIFAPRGTPVLAAVAGRVSRVTTNRLGGNVIWLREAAHGRRLYYAHLDRQAVIEDTWVEPGDTLGFVGNTGNARRTPPHLHFGIYLRGEGPVDPFFHLYEPPEQPATFAGEPSLVGWWARVGQRGARVYARPGSAEPLVAQVEDATPVAILAGTGRWYYARLPDGREGYLGVTGVEPLEPLRLAAVAGPAVIRTAPAPLGVEVDSIPDGEVVPVLGRHGTFLLVRDQRGLTGWMWSGALASTGATEGAVAAVGAGGGAQQADAGIAGAR